MSETFTAAGKLAPDQPWCHKCGLLYGPPEREAGTAAIFLCALTLTVLGGSCGTTPSTLSTSRGCSKS